MYITYDIHTHTHTHICPSPSPSILVGDATRALRDVPIRSEREELRRRTASRYSRYGGGEEEEEYPSADSWDRDDAAGRRAVVCYMYLPAGSPQACPQASASSLVTCFVFWGLGCRAYMYIYIDLYLNTCVYMRGIHRSEGSTHHIYIIPHHILPRTHAYIHSDTHTHNTHITYTHTYKQIH